MADTNKIRYGIKGCHYAKATIAADGSATYETPVPLPGAVSLALTAEGDTTPFYADNIVYYTSVANNGYSGDLELAKIPDSFLTDCLGYIADTNGVLVEDAGAVTQPFALLFQFEGDANATRHVLYNVTSGRPSVAGQTTDATIEPQTETAAFTAVAIHNASLGKDIVKASASPTQATAYEGWFDAVYQPSAPTP
jgi:phi13 family phage major tail protein